MRQRVSLKAHLERTFESADIVKNNSYKNNLCTTRKVTPIFYLNNLYVCDILRFSELKIIT